MSTCRLLVRLFLITAGPAAIAAGVVLCVACSSSPPRVERSASYSLDDMTGTWLAQQAGRLTGQQPGDSGILLLDTGREAFTSRIALADSAERSLDAQYYIWNADTTGRLLAERLLRAADRGVRVRLLLDDYGVGNKDNELVALDAHPAIEVRVYNPFRSGLRSGLRRWTSMATGFSRLNRRMHSKTFIVDGSFAIVGGRNIGDEYFDARRDMNHRDRELLATGPVVADVARQFDVMWNSDWALPVSALVSVRLSQGDLLQRYQALQAFADSPASQPYPLPDTAEARRTLLAAWHASVVRAPAEFVYNPPEITAGDEANGSVVANHLLELITETQQEILIESAYFIVSAGLLQQVQPLLEQGVSIDVLTNSLATTDVWTIHAGYTRNRKDVLRQGIGLYEFRPDAASCQRLIDNRQLDCGALTFSLHAKSVVFDRKLVFVGSFNLNPRSRYLNTETALLVHSPELAGRIARDIEENMLPENSWRVALDAAGRLEWHARTAGVDTVVRQEPDTGTWLRVKSLLFSLLPAEKYL